MPPTSRGSYGNRRKTPYGKWGDSCRVNLDVDAGLRSAIYIMPEEDKEYQDLIGEEGPDVFLGFTAPGRQQININLTKLTHNELVALREVFLMAFANAQPIVLQRDATAKEALNNGDDSYVRVYRRLPQIVVREGQKFKHYPIVRRGLEWVDGLGGKFDVIVRQLRGTGESIPESLPLDAEPGNGEPQDRNVP